MSKRDYVYLGRCEDGCYWFVWRGIIRRVCYAGGRCRTRIETVCRVVDALCSESLLASLPQKVQQYLRQLQERGLMCGEKGEREVLQQAVSLLSKLETVLEETLKLVRELRQMLEKHRSLR